VGTNGDDPSTGEVLSHEVQHRDILIVASDGLWDNLFNVKIIDLIRPFVSSSDELVDPSLVAEVIAKEAERYSNMQDYLSPFGKNAREHRYNYEGGKPDDITVVVAQILLSASIRH
jgi:protein phosphatase PTC7